MQELCHARELALAKTRAEEGNRPAMNAIEDRKLPGLK
jgi:hypothetical protein